MEIIQILIIIFALFAFSRSVLRIKEKSITKYEFLFWSAIWVIVIIVASLPSITDFFTKPLGIARGIDVAIYISIILLFYLNFRLYVKTEQNNQELTKIVRELAKEKLNQSNQDIKKENKIIFPKEID